MHMFFRKKKAKSDANSNSRHCESPNCPSPNALYPIEECFNVNGKIFCQFCYARQLAENVSVMEYQTTKTKKVDKVELNRISLKPNSWESGPQTDANLSRIGPPSINDKYIEEITIWSDLLRELKYEVDVNKITKVPYSSKIRILDTSQGLILLTIVSKDEKLLKEEETKLLSTVLQTKVPKFSSFNISKISDKFQDWVIDNKLVSSKETITDNLLLITEPSKSNFIPLEEYTEETKTGDLQLFLHELGRYFYFFNFIGCKAPIKIITVSENDSFSFLPAFANYTNESFSDAKSSLRDISLTLPYLLDQENLDSFLEGAAALQKELEDVLTKESKTKELILKFLSQFHIKFDEKKQLNSLDLYL